MLRDPQQLIRLMLAGAMLYITVYQFWLYRLRPEDATHRSAGLWTLNATLFVLCRVVQYSDVEDAWAQHAIGMQLTLGLLTLPIGVHVVRVFSDIPENVWLRWLIRLSAISALLPWVDAGYGELVWRDDALGHRYRTIEASPTLAIALAWIVIGTASFVWMLRRAGPNEGTNAQLYGKRRAVLLLAMAVIIPAGINDILLSEGLLNSIAVLDYAFGVLVLGLAYLLARESVLFFGVLEERVEARTNELRERQAQLVASDRLASLGTLAAGVAHEINNPLTYIGGNLESIIQKMQRDSSCADTETLAREAREGVRAVRDIVDQLRVFARTETRKHRKLDIREALNTAIAMSRNRIRHHAQLDVRIDTVPLVLGDAGQLTQVFLNLLTNAQDALVDKGGTIDVHVSLGGEGKCRIIVRDSGVGIPPDELERIFEPFFTTKGRLDGTGLGLSICHGIITDHEGAIRVESTPGKGTTVTVSLPVIAVEDSLPVSDVPPVPRREIRRRILLVDDDPLVGRAIARMLSGHEVVVVDSGSKAIERAEAEHFDVILCDLMMPGVDGMDVYVALEDVSCFAFVTGGAFTPRAADFLQRTDVPVLRKPPEADEVRRLVQQLAGDGHVS